MVSIILKDLKINKTYFFNKSKIKNVQANKNIKIILAGMMAQESYGEKYAKEFNSIYPDLATKHKITLYPFLLEGVALKPELNLDDGKHPNTKGVQVIANQIFPVIQNKIINN